jgi:hypothetical protein
VPTPRNITTTASPIHIAAFPRFFGVETLVAGAGWRDASVVRGTALSVGTLDEPGGITTVGSLSAAASGVPSIRQKLRLPSLYV